MHAVVVDNYDSFTFNLVQALAAAGAEVSVFRNDAISVDEVIALAPDRIVLSPGPSTPQNAGICIELIRRVGGRIPILGVCLGYQAIGVACGARLGRARRPMHGKTSMVLHDGKGIFCGLPSPMRAARYHSLEIAADSLPPELIASAHTTEGELMAFRHAGSGAALEGVLFHPESYMSEHGASLLAGFVSHSTVSRRSDSGRTEESLP